MKVVIIKEHLLDRDTRANKIIKSLINHGYSVTFLGWDRTAVAERTEYHEKGLFHKEIILKFKAPSGIRVLLYMPIWWSFTFYKLMTTDWDIAHAIQIISSVPAIMAGKIRRKPVVYDMLDTYEDSIIMPRYIRNFFVLVDKFFMHSASAVVLADEAQIDEVGGIPNRKVISIYDSPNITCNNSKYEYQKNEKFTIFFAGSLSSGKKLNLDKLFAAIRDLEGIKVIIAGYGDLVDEIIAYSRKMPDKLEFIGEIEYEEVIKRSTNADLLFVLRDPILLVNKYICGSKILEAMVCGTPIMVNKCTSTANKVFDEKCGLVVDANNIEEIKEAIITLRDNPELCKELGTNCRKAYEERYSWDIMEQRLLNLYKNLVDRAR